MTIDMRPVFYMWLWRYSNIRQLYAMNKLLIEYIQFIYYDTNTCSVFDEECYCWVHVVGRGYVQMFNFLIVVGILLVHSNEYERHKHKLYLCLIGSNRSILWLAHFVLPLSPGQINPPPPAPCPYTRWAQGVKRHNSRGQCRAHREMCRVTEQPLHSVWST